MPKITIEADAEQIAILLSHLECVRDATTVAAQVEDAARRWRDGSDEGFSYSVVKITPVYLQLLEQWQRLTGDAERRPAAVIEAKSANQFRRALREANEAIALNAIHG